MGFPILVRLHLNIESGARNLSILTTCTELKKKKKVNDAGKCLDTFVSMKSFGLQDTHTYILNTAYVYISISNNLPSLISIFKLRHKLWIWHFFVVAHYHFQQSHDRYASVNVRPSIWWSHDMKTVPHQLHFVRGNQSPVDSLTEGFLSFRFLVNYYICLLILVSSKHRGIIKFHIVNEIVPVHVTFPVLQRYRWIA